MKFAGVDEAGRGPLAGPVVSAAVILDINNEIKGLNDSKKLTPKQRLTLSNKIKETSLAWSVGVSSSKEIDLINILQASLLSMERAIKGLSIKPQKVLVDGNHKPKTEIECEAIIKGDALIPSIMAASIVAKVTRDKIMQEIDQSYPEYGFKKHKGYPTKEHLNALELLGPCKEHRFSYKPVIKAMKRD